MARYLTQSELRNGELKAVVRGINSAFLLDIKQDHVEFRELFEQVSTRLRSGAEPTPRALADLLGRLRDEIETYFALEEFYGCFDLAAGGDATLARQVGELKRQHEQLYGQLNQLVEQAEQRVYQEDPQLRSSEIVRAFFAFCDALQQHELLELDLISRRHNTDTGVGD